jgi:hypothetical protein
MGFHYNLKRRTNELFSTSLYKVDCLIEDRLNPFLLIKKELVHVPEAYRDFIDIFSKAASDRLPPHRSYDYKIVLEKKILLRIAPYIKCLLRN